MAKEMGDIQAELEQLRVSLERLRARVPDYHTWTNLIQAAGNLSQLLMCVILQPGNCYTSQSTPGGQLTITNNTGQNGTVELKWGADVFTGEVQPQSTRIVQPLAWPATICNTGSVPLTVCPS